MGLIDTHTHLESFARRGELAPVLARAREAGLEALITIGTEPEDWMLYREIARAEPGFVHYTVGLHPCSVTEHWALALEQIDGYFCGEAPRPVALGEIGLDRFHLPKDQADAARIFAWQRDAFAAGLEIAKRWKTPVVVHSRGAFNECVEMVDASGVDWSSVVFHCFTENEAEMTELMKRGGYGSFTGVITYKNAGNVRQAMLAQGLDRLMVETDAPYLTPVPHRGKSNEPGYVRHTAAAAAKEFGVDDATLFAKSTATARAFFRL